MEEDKDQLEQFVALFKELSDGEYIVIKKSTIIWFIIFAVILICIIKIIRSYSSANRRDSAAIGINEII